MKGSGRASKSCDDSLARYIVKRKRNDNNDHNDPNDDNNSNNTNTINNSTNNNINNASRIEQHAAPGRRRRCDRRRHSFGGLRSSWG